MKKNWNKKILLIISCLIVIFAIVIFLLPKKTISTTPTTYTVSFETRGGNIIESMKIIKGEEIETLPIPQKDGYTFRYWEDKHGTPIYEKALIDGDIQLYAVWE